MAVAYSYMLYQEIEGNDEHEWWPGLNTARKKEPFVSQGKSGKSARSPKELIIAGEKIQREKL